MTLVLETRYSKLRFHEIGLYRYQSAECGRSFISAGLRSWYLYALPDSGRLGSTDALLSPTVFAFQTAGRPSLYVFRVTAESFNHGGLLLRPFIKNETQAV